MKILLNLGKFPRNKWEKGMEDGWDKIIDIKMPYINQYKTVADIDELAELYLESIKNTIKTLSTEDLAWIYIDGDMTFTYLLLLLVDKDIPIAVPVIDRIKTDKGNTYVFRSWRFLP